jgi:N-methylhydantoinase A
MGNLCLGIDTGGTFTDLVLVDLDTGVYHYHKLPTTTKDPAQGILDGIASIVGQAGVPCEAVTFLVLGITIATNAVLEGKTARTGMLSTRGFRDILELARQRRPHLFNFDVRKPQPPAARDCRCEVTERVAHDGTVVTPLHEDDVRWAIACISGRGVEATSVCFLHAYANPAHESRAKALIQELWPEVYVCTSCDVLAEFREFERFATATVNASLMPIMDRYLERFEQGVHELGIRSAPRVMQSNGGAVTPGAVGEFVVNPGQPDEQRLPSAVADVPLPRGSVLSVRAPGGGGFGPVEQRDPRQVERDVREARISEEHAKGVYRWHTPA